MSDQKQEFELMLARREREHEEGANLITMLQNDVERLNGER